MKGRANILINKDVELKKFFNLIYGDEIVTPGRFKDNQFIRLTDFEKNTLFFNDVDELVRASLTRFKGRNAYFTLATTDGISGQTEALVKRTIIALDFDNKHQAPGFSKADIMARLNKIGLKYHAIINSGNGYHVYFAIEPTTNHSLVNAVTKALQVELGADPDATKETQVLRVPYTINAKDPNNKKPVNLIKQYDLKTVRRYNIETLAKRFLTARNEARADYNTQNLITNTNIPLCVKKIIEQGSEEGHRTTDLQKIVVVLKQRNKTLSEVLRVLHEWTQKCKPVFDDRLEYQAERIYKEVAYIRLGCDSCNIKNECRNLIESDFNFDGELITIAESQARSLKHSTRKGTKILNGNDILILGVLKNHADGLTRAQIVEELTYTDKKTGITTVALSERTLKDTIRNLKQNGFIEATSDRAPVYTAHKPRTVVELTYKISYSATYEAIKGRISTEELRLYNYMRYLQHVEQRSNPKASKGNLYQVTQSQLAKDLGVTQGRISQMIESLLAEKIISIWHREKSKNNGFEFNIYRLNY